MSQPPGLQDFIRVYDRHLEPDRCQQLIGDFEQATSAWAANGRGYRAGLEQSGWTELNLNRHVPADRIDALDAKVDLALKRYNLEIGTSIPVPNSPRRADYILKRYRRDSGERFQLHFDSVYEVSNRYLVFLWYLNAVPQGGETVFPDQRLAIRPEAGRLLVFPPYWLFPHAGEPPVGGDKYILSTYLLF